MWIVARMGRHSMSCSVPVLQGADSDDWSKRSVLYQRLADRLMAPEHWAGSPILCVARTERRWYNDAISRRTVETVRRISDQSGRGACGSTSRVADSPSPYRGTGSRYRRILRTRAVHNRSEEHTSELQSPM